MQYYQKELKAVVENTINNLHNAALLLGSNLGDRKLNLIKAIEELKKLGRIVKISSVYKTKAWGNEDQPYFYNQAVLIETKLSPEKLLEEILDIEKRFGRKRIIKWQPRTIDIDILIFDDQIIESENLIVPHSQLHKRRFALIPLKEIQPGWFHPVFEKDINTLLNECDDLLEVEKVEK